MNKKRKIIEYFQFPQCSIRCPEIQFQPMSHFVYIWFEVRESILVKYQVAAFIAYISLE